MIHKNKLNVAVQVLPEGYKQEAYDRVDLCISLIAASGLKYRVCPFETVIEGYWDEIMELVKKLQQACFDEGTKNILIILKIQTCRDADVNIEDKTDKYDH